MRIKALPEAFSTLKDLRILNLARCNQLTELPEGLGQLTKLVTLNLSDCSRLTKLPYSIVNLHALTHLDCEGCVLMPSPETVGKRQMTVPMRDESFPVLEETETSILYQILPGKPAQGNTCFLHRATTCCAEKTKRWDMLVFCFEFLRQRVENLLVQNMRDLRISEESISAVRKKITENDRLSSLKWLSADKKTRESLMSIDPKCAEQLIINLEIEQRKKYEGEAPEQRNKAYDKFSWIRKDDQLFHNLLSFGNRCHATVKQIFMNSFLVIVK